jgi:hypothetical protein
MSIDPDDWVAQVKCSRTDAWIPAWFATHLHGVLVEPVANASGEAKLTFKSSTREKRLSRIACMSNTYRDVLA